MYVRDLSAKVLRYGLLILDFFSHLVFRTQHSVLEMGSVSFLRLKDCVAPSWLGLLGRVVFGVVDNKQSPETSTVED
jgi:hypothetical protein